MTYYTLRITVFLLIAINFMKAQSHSYMKFSPPFSKDTLDIRDTDTLQYDLNIFYANNNFSLKSITGQLKIYNHFDLVFMGMGFSVYNGGSKVLTLTDKNEGTTGKWDIKAQSNPDISNFLNFEYRTSPTDKYNGDFSWENLKKFIGIIRLGETTYHIGNKDLFVRVYGKLKHYSLQEKYIEVFFQKEDIGDVNIFNDKGGLVFKVSYDLLMDLK